MSVCTHKTRVHANTGNARFFYLNCESWGSFLNSTVHLTQSLLCHTWMSGVPGPLSFFEWFSCNTQRDPSHLRLSRHKGGHSWADNTRSLPRRLQLPLGQHNWCSTLPAHSKCWVNWPCNSIQALLSLDPHPSAPSTQSLVICVSSTSGVFTGSSSLYPCLYSNVNSPEKLHLPPNAPPLPQVAFSTNRNQQSHYTHKLQIRTWCYALQVYILLLNESSMKPKIS